MKLENIKVRKEQRGLMFGYTVEDKNGKFLAFSSSDINYTINSIKEMYYNKGFLFSI